MVCVGKAEKMMCRLVACQQYIPFSAIERDPPAMQMGQNTLFSWPEDKQPDDRKLKIFVAEAETLKEKKPGFTYKWELATVICGISNLSW